MVGLVLYRQRRFFPVSRQPILVPLSEVFLYGGVCYDNDL